MKPTQPSRVRGWNLGTRILLALILGVGAMLVTSNQTAEAAGPPGRWGSRLMNNSPVGIGIVTDLGNSYAYVQPPWSWTPWNARGGYTGAGYCTNVYYNLGNGWEYRFQIRGAQYWDFPYWIAYEVRTDSWRC